MSTAENFTHSAKRSADTKDYDQNCQYNHSVSLEYRILSFLEQDIRKNEVQ